MTAPEPFSSFPDEVPSELSAEFDRRVEALLERWRRLYAFAGVTQASPMMDRQLAEERVGKEMGLR